MSRRSWWPSGAVHAPPARSPARTWDGQRWTSAQLWPFRGNYKRDGAPGIFSPNTSSEFAGVERLLSAVLPSTRVSVPFQPAPAAYSIAAVFLWGASDFWGGYACRRVNAFVLTAFSHLCACVLMLAISFAGHAPLPSRASMLWSIAASASGGFSLALFYRALASGQMGLAAPIAALIGAAIPTLADLALEGAPSRWSVAGFVLAVLAIWLITKPEPHRGDSDTGQPTGVALAALAGVGFAGFYLCIHQAKGSPVFLAGIGRIASF